MNIISQLLDKKYKDGNCALIPFITAGYPSINSTLQVLQCLDKHGADAIELGVPYADALADGPIIQEASKVALKQKTYIDDVLKILKKATFLVSTPIIIFTYYNPILVRGIQKFIYDIYYNGAQGLIVPDLPIEEIDYIMSLCQFYDLELILFIAPTSSTSRISKILSKSSNCIYLVSSTGVTGIRNSIDSNICSLSNYIKSKTNKLLIVGFGISNTLQASTISKLNIDGIVIGSAFIKILSNFNKDSDFLDQLGYFCGDIKKSISNES